MTFFLCCGLVSSNVTNSVLYFLIFSIDIIVVCLTGLAIRDFSAKLVAWVVFGKGYLRKPKFIMSGL